MGSTPEILCLVHKVLQAITRGIPKSINRGRLTRIYGGFKYIYIRNLFYNAHKELCLWYIMVENQNDSVEFRGFRRGKSNNVMR